MQKLIHFVSLLESTMTSLSSFSDTLAEPRLAGPSCEGSGFHPIKYTNWNVAGTLSSSLPYSPSKILINKQVYNSFNPYSYISQLLF